MLPGEESPGNAFNRALAQCEGDLSLSLANSWTSLALNGGFILLSIVSLIALFCRRFAVRAPKPLLLCKLVTGTICVALQIALLALTLVQPHRRTQCSLVSGVLNVVAAVFAVALSLFAHYKSHRPSILLCSYLFLSVLSNVARCQELWFATEDSNDVTFAAVHTVMIIVQLLSLGTNSKWRMSWLGWEAKDHSPEETSSIFSLGLFSWLNSLLLRGYRGVLSVDDLYALDPAIATKVPGAEACQLPIASESGKGYWAVLKWSFKPVLGPVLLPVLPRLCLVGFSFCQPFFIRSLLNFVTVGENGGEAPTSAAGLVGASILINVGIAVSTSLYWYYQERAQSIMRGHLVSSIYRKTSELQATGDMAAVTLMSTDVDRIYMGLRFIHEVWASVLQVGVSCWLLQRELGLVFLALLILAALGFATSFGMSKYAVKYQRDWMKYIQKRIGVTSKVLSHIKDYRISGLIGPITDLVQNERVVEIHHGGKSRFIIAIAGAVSQIPFAFAPLIAFVFGPRRMDSTLAFTVLSYLSLLTTPLKLVIQILPVLISCMACLERIHTFVSAPPKKDHRLSKQGRGAEKSTNALLEVRDGQFGWADKSSVAKGINMSVDKGTVTFITGPVASGKTTLLKALLGEVPYSEGEVIFGFDAQKVSYCDQTPFLMNASVKENIIGFSPYNPGRYRAVIHATLLQEDFNNLPKGDRTKVGSKGVSLSGGQRQRISLGRALYHDAELLVLDDIFTGLDADTQEKICRRVFGRDGLLRSRAATVILATQASQFAHVADQILELSTEGIVAKHTKMTASTTAQNQSDIQDSSSKSSDLDISAENGYDMPEKLYKEESPDGDQERIAEQKKATTAALTTDRTVYWHYMASIGVFPLLAYAFCTTGMGFATNFPTVWLKIWSDDSLKGYQYNPFAFYMGIFGLLAGLTVFFLFVGGFISLRIFVRLSGTNLHKAALETAVHSSLRFLTTTDTGTVLNLFSQDMTIIDSQLPQMTNNLVFNIASAVVQAVIIAISSAYLAISYPFFIVILYVVQRFYLPTSKQLRILDLEAKSPLYTHFLDTINGLSTIRAFAWFPQYMARNKELLDTSQRPNYLLAIAQQWLLLTMQIIVAILTTILASLATSLRTINAGSIGGGLVTLMTFSMTLNVVITSYTGLEIALGGISRLKAFSEDTEREDKPGEDTVPGEEWPPKGEIVFRETSASYTNDPDALVLSNLSLTIRPREKVALCGRTGRILDSLQSSDTPSSCIEIDGTRLESIDRTTLRMRLITLSQDSIFLPEGSTFRENLDPWKVATAEEMTDVLDVVGLKDMITGRGGLDASVQNAGLSVGQQQMFTLGRAVLRRRVRARIMAEKQVAEGGILLLDEMTASVDKETEKGMMSMVRREFEAYTVLMVTHSIDAAASCDRVIVLDKGEVMEDGDPRVLMGEQGSMFRALAVAAGGE